MTEFSHIPVLIHETIDALKINPDGVTVDCTAGGGGHSAAVLERLSERGRLICIDRDPDAVAVLQNRFGTDKRVTVVHENYANLTAVLASLSIPAVDSILADLGVSSFQLDEASRGFSFHQDAPLDMRMSKTGRTAAELVNTLPESALRKILYEYGEEKFAPRIAAAIVRERRNEPILTTLRLAEIVSAAYPAAARRGGHPARKTFQALRIEVNGELADLATAIQHMFHSLKPEGRLAIITFHSLEDRIVKNTFASFTVGCTCPPEFPICVCGKKPQGRICGKPQTAGGQELAENQRSRSAKLRVIEKTIS